MKRFFVIFAVFCFLMCFLVSPVKASEQQFARITDENVFLFKTANESFEPENVLFKLPTSYFVLILNEAEDFFNVQFQGFEGFVKKQSVTKVFKAPATPFPAGITFDVNKSASLSIRSLPSVNSELLGFIPSGETANFVGETIGDEAISGLGNVWFFSSFEQDGQTISGYVYAPLTENLTEIPPNTEDLPTTIKNTEPEPSFLSENLTNPNNLWLVCVLILIVLLLFCITFFPFFASKKLKTKVLEITSAKE